MKKIMRKLDMLRSSCGLVIIRISMFFQLNYGLLIIFRLRLYDKKRLGQVAGLPCEKDTKLYIKGRKFNLKEQKSTF